MAVHEPPHMPLLTELDGFAGGVVAIDLSLLTELEDPRPPLDHAGAASFSDQIYTYGVTREMMEYLRTFPLRTERNLPKHESQV